MKNRRIAIVAFMLVAVLTLGIGYAALTTTLDITGAVSVSASQAEEAFSQDVKFVSVSTGEGYTANINPNNDNKAAFTINPEGGTPVLKGKGDKVTMTFTIGNVGDVDATVSLKTETNTNLDYFTLTHDLVDGTTLPSEGGQVTVAVTVELIDTPVANVSGSFVLEIDAVSVDPSAAAAE